MYLIMASFHDSITKFVTYRGVYVAEELIRRLEINLRKLFFKYMKDVKHMKSLTPQEVLKYHTYYIP